MNCSSNLVYDPCKPEEWGNVQHHMFYEFLKSYIAHKIKEHLPSLSLDIVEECLVDIICSKVEDDSLADKENEYLEDQLGMKSHLYDYLFEVET